MDLNVRRAGANGFEVVGETTFVGPTGASVTTQVIFDSGATESTLTGDTLRNLGLRDINTVVTARDWLNRPVFAIKFGPVTVRIKVDKYSRRWWCLWLCKTRSVEQRECQLKIAQGAFNLLGTDFLRVCGLKLEIDGRNMTAELIAP